MQIPVEILRWLPGPILTAEHRAITLRRTATDLKRRASRRNPNNPDTWIAVARSLKIRVEKFCRPGEGRGRLVFDEENDEWVIYLNVAYSRLQQASTLVHELGHYYFLRAKGEWLCGEPVVYYYEGDVDEEYHSLARELEWIVVPRWTKVPYVGLFACMKPDADEDGGDTEGMLEIERTAFE